MTIVTNTEEHIVALLESTNREGMDQMIAYLKMEGFFTAPASTRFHGSYESSDGRRGYSELIHQRGTA